MLRSVRKKVAASISKVDEVEDFHFHTWLRAPLSENISLGTITSSLKSLPDIKYSIELPNYYQHSVGLDSSNILQLPDYYFFEKVKSNTIFFTINQVETEGIDLTGIVPKPQGYIAQNVEFNFINNPVRDYKVRFDSKLPEVQQSLLTTPEVVDCLSAMVPEVINIVLLKAEEFNAEVKVDKFDIDEIKKSKLKKINVPEIKKAEKIYKVKVPGIGKFDPAVSKIKLEQIKTPKSFDKSGLKFSQNSVTTGKIDFTESINYKYYDGKDEELKEVADFKQKGFKNPKKIKDELRLILNQIQKTEWKERKEQQFRLLPYEEEGAGFLADTDKALLIDEFGLNKQRETLAALKFLFNNRIVKSALIVCAAGKAGNIELSRKCDLEIGWLGNLIKYCPELSISEIKGNDNERTDAWNKSAMVYVADQSVIVNDYHLKIIEQKKFKQFDCIILDEVHLLIDRGEKVSEFISHVNSRILWALTGLVDEKIKSDLNSMLNKKMKIDGVKIRRKEDVKDKAPQFIWNENWVTLDEKQQQEYKETLVECQKDLRKVLETGNPYRFQANIFTLLHKLKQICNFGQGKFQSPKADLLLEQVSMIRNNNKKVIVFSQYERLGIKSIEKLFEENEIEYILAPGSLSVDDMDKSVEKFKSKNEITAFITDAKISKLRFGSFNVPYLIKFDYSWNPINVWELQDLFEFKGKAKDFSINIYTYNVHNTIDQNVTELLSAKGFLNKNLMEMMQSKVFDELISVDEWLKFFNLAPIKDTVEQSPESQLQLISKLNSAGFKTMVSKLFNKVGYSKIDIIDEPSTKSFNIVGESSRNGNSVFLIGKVIPEETVSPQAVTNLITKSGSLQNKKLFIITKGSFEEGCENVINESVTLIDGISFAKIIQGFNIQESPLPEKTETAE